MPEADKMTSLHPPVHNRKKKGEFNDKPYMSQAFSKF